MADCVQCVSCSYTECTADTRSCVCVCVCSVCRVPIQNALYLHFGLSYYKSTNIRRICYFRLFLACLAENLLRSKFSFARFSVTVCILHSRKFSDGSIFGQSRISTFRTDFIFVQCCMLNARVRMWYACIVLYILFHRI